MPVWRRKSSRKIRAAFSRRGSGWEGSSSQKLLSIGICPEPGWLSTDLGQGISGSDPVASDLGPDLMVCSREKELRAMITSMTKQGRTALPPTAICRRKNIGSCRQRPVESQILQDQGEVSRSLEHGILGAIYGPKMVHNAIEWDKNSNCQNPAKKSGVSRWLRSSTGAGSPRTMDQNRRGQKRLFSQILHS